MKKQTEKLTDFERVKACLNMFQNRPVYCPPVDIENLEALINIIPLLQAPEIRPDAYAYGDGELLLLEHFTFDNSKIIKHGSKQRAQIAETDRKLETRISKGEVSPIQAEYVERTGTAYIHNLLTQFNKHARKIEEYINTFPSTALQPINHTIMGFIMEDTSTFGCQIKSIVNGKPKIEEVYACFAKEFLDVFERTPLLDFVVYLTSRERNKGIMSFITKNSLSLYRKNQKELTNIGHFLYEQSFAIMQDIPLKEPPTPELLNLLKNIGKK